MRSGRGVWRGRSMDMPAFVDELETCFDEERVRDLEELIDELTDTERASVTLSARLAGADGDITLARRSPARCSIRPARGCSYAEVTTTASSCSLQSSRPGPSGAVLRASPPCEEASV